MFGCSQLSMRRERRSETGAINCSQTRLEAAATGGVSPKTGSIARADLCISDSLQVTCTHGSCVLKADGVLCKWRLDKRLYSSKLLAFFQPGQSPGLFEPSTAHPTTHGHPPYSLYNTWQTSHNGVSSQDIPYFQPKATTVTTEI